ncbi:copper-binding protein [Phenylobacterium sp.]|uniref:copper-binding protein n=1 Tax=Phenylobacterium sp. TaxID=1871053 RepID=UPI002C4CE634|nr:copper-binding protein [Phenylobacterium sp.]HVI32023.1 copper-binding protein [Phenylobacterium sp.]
MKLIAAAAVAAFALAGTAVAQPHDHAAHAAPAAAAAVTGVGVVKAVDARAGTVTIAHEPIKALGWPAMTMPFKVSDPALLKAAAVGDKVTFQLNGQQIVALKKG